MNNPFLVCSDRELRALPTQWLLAEVWDEAGDLLYDLEFMDATVRRLGIDDLLLGYAAALRLLPEEEGWRDKLVTTNIALGQEAHHLRDWEPSGQPGFFLQQFRNRCFELDQPDLTTRAENLLMKWHLPYLREWNKVGHEPQGLIRTLTGHRSAVHGLAITTDGRLVISASDDRTLMVWDLATGRKIHELTGHASYVDEVAVTPDGHLAVSASCDLTLKVWDLETGQLVRTLAPSEILETIDQTPNEQWFNRTVSEISDDMNGWYHRSVALSADGRLAVSGMDKLRVWDLATGQPLSTFEGMASAESIAITPDDRFLVAAYSNTIKIWDLVNGNCLRTLEDHTDKVKGLAITPDGRSIISASDDHTLKIWDLASGRVLHTLDKHTSEVNSVAITPDGRLAISASRDRTLKVWDTSTWQCVCTWEAHADIVWDVIVTPDGRSAISASRDGTLKVWDISAVLNTNSEQSFWRTSTGRARKINDVAITYDSRLAVFSTSDNTLAVWDLAIGQYLRTLAGHKDQIASVVSVGFKEHMAISASYDKTLKLWNLDNGQTLCTLEHADRVDSVAVTQDGKTAISTSMDKMLNVWDLNTGQSLRAIKVDGADGIGTVSAIGNVCITPDGRLAVFTSSEFEVESHGSTVWNLITGKFVRILDDLWHVVACVTITPDGKRAITASDNNTLKIWDLASGQQVGELTGHKSQVNNVALMPNGRWAVSAAGDHTLKIWDLFSDQEVLSYGTNASKVVVGPNEKMIATIDPIGIVRFLEWVQFE